MSRPDQPDRYLVHGHIVDPATNEISCGDEVVRIEPKSMEVLVYLFEHAGEVVSRGQVQEVIWGDVIVGDDSLTNAIIKIRKAFGDDARAPKVVETIPKRGYRLIAGVEEYVDAKNEPPRSLPRRGMMIGSAALVLAVLAVALGWLFQPDDTALQLKRPSDGRTRIAVAPFENLSGDPAQDYLAIGVQQTLLTGLAAIPEVAAMRSAATGGNSTADYRLEGSVLHNGDRIRIDTRIMDGENGTLLSSQRHDRPFSDLMAVEAEIEETLLASLAVEIDRANLVNQSRGYTDSIEAYDLFLRARAALLPRDRSGTERARSLYDRAIVRDPRFARAYAGLALVHAAEYRNGWAEDGQVALDRALAMARTALEIQPDLPEHYWVMGYVQTQRRNLADAEAALSEAQHLNPDYADALALLGGIQTYAGHPEKTLPLLREAMQLEPAAGYLYYLLLGRAYYFLDDCQQALINLNEAALRNPDNSETRLYKAACLVRQGDKDGAAWEIEEIRSIDADFSLGEFLQTYPMVSSDQTVMLTRDLGSAGLN